MRILVAIANHGTKNSKFLERLVAEYRAMSGHVADIVVLSDTKKSCGTGIEVLVGAPHKNPWSLPYAHKRLFAERADRYDLFIYSEDDTLITEKNIDAFLRVTKLLPRDHIAGFVRYEEAANGARTYTTMHGQFHWDSNSVLRLEGGTFAYYTNEHSACYILTQEQLRRAIASGGFLLPPREGRYDMLVTAATDPYTQCGMRKVICISHFDEFCLHHLPNVYWHKMGLPAVIVERELEELLADASPGRVNGPLFRPDTSLPDGAWDKNYYEACREDVVSAIPEDVRTLLSVGCGCGSTEEALKARGVEVTAIPMDRIVGVTAAGKRVRVLSPELDQAMGEVKDQRFDCVLLNDVICRAHDPKSLLHRVKTVVSASGRVVITSRNGGLFWQLKTKGLREMLLTMRTQQERFDRFRYHFVGLATMKAWLGEAGLRVDRVACSIPPRLSAASRLAPETIDAFVARDFLLVCSHQS